MGLLLCCTAKIQQDVSQHEAVASNDNITNEFANDIPWHNTLVRGYTARIRQCFPFNDMYYDLQDCILDIVVKYLLTFEFNSKFAGEGISIGAHGQTISKNDRNDDTTDSLSTTACAINIGFPFSSTPPARVPLCLDL